MQWAPDGSTLAFVSTSRDHKRRPGCASPTRATGAVREVFDETVEDLVRERQRRDQLALPAAVNEVLWCSERNDWGHLYLYDLATRQAQARGDHAASGTSPKCCAWIEATRTLWFRGVGREARARSVLTSTSTRSSLDGGDAGAADARRRPTTRSRCRRTATHFVDTYSTPTTPPVTVLRDASDGKVLAEIARADITRLQAAGWVPPEPITVKARDGKTDLYGLMFKPTNFDPDKKYPIINYIYPGPQAGSVGTPRLQRRARRPPGAGRTRLHRGRDRRHGHAVALEGLPRRLLRRHRRQHAARPGRRHEASWPSAIRGSTSTASASGAIPAAATRPPTAMFTLSGLLQGRHRRERQPRQPQLRGRLGARSGRACSRSRQGRHEQLRRPGQPEPRRASSRASCC